MQKFSVELSEGRAVDITDLLQEAVCRKDEGILTVMTDNGVTGIFLLQNSPAVGEFAAEMARQYPARSDFKKYGVSPNHCAACFRAAVTGNTLSLLCENGSLFLPHMQRVFAINYETTGPVTFYAVVT